MELIQLYDCCVLPSQRGKRVKSNSKARRWLMDFRVKRCHGKCLNSDKPCCRGTELVGDARRVPGGNLGCPYLSGAEPAVSVAQFALWCNPSDSQALRFLQIGQATRCAMNESQSLQFLFGPQKRRYQTRVGTGAGPVLGDNIKIWLYKLAG